MITFNLPVCIGVIFIVTIILWLILCPVERDRHLFGNHPSRLILFTILSVVGIVLTLWGIGELFNIPSSDLWTEHIEDSEGVPKWWTIVGQFADPGNLPLSQNNGRYLALACALCGIVLLSGFLVSSIVNFLSKRSQKWQHGLIHYDKGFNNYVVIIGVNDQTSTIIKRCLQRKNVKYVLIQTRQDVEKMRMRLDLDLDKEEENRLVFYFAERTSYEDIANLHLEKAQEIYILGEDVSFEKEQDHDAFNIKCLEHISSYLDKHRGNRKRCHVNFEYQSTFTAFKSTHIYKSLDKKVEFIPFNVHEIWAKKVFVDNYAVVPTGKKGEVRVQDYFPLDSNGKDVFGIKESDDYTVHLIIMGMNQMGTALATQAALIAHYPNFHRNRKFRTTITFIDDQAKVEGEFFRGRYKALFDLCRCRIVNNEDEILTAKWDDPMKDGRYKHLWGDDDNGNFAKDEDIDGNFTDIQWEFIQANVASAKIHDYLVTEANQKNVFTTIAICFNHSQQSIATALYLPEMVFRRVSQVLVYQQNNFDLISKVGTGEKIWKRYDKLRPFGMIERSYTENPFDRSSAKLLHYLYSRGKMKLSRPGMEEYKYREAAPDISTFEGVTIDAKFVKEVNDLWNQQGIVFKLSNIDMVDTIPTKLRSLGLAVDDLGSFDIKLSEGDNWKRLAMSEHTRWLTERLLMGYRPLDYKDVEWLKFPIVKNMTDDQLCERRKMKKYIEKKWRAHLDICSNTMLHDIDPDSRYNDMNVIAYIPQIIRYAELLNVMRIVENTNYGLTQKAFFTFSDNWKNKWQTKCAIRLLDEGEDSEQARANYRNASAWIMDTVVTQQQWKRIMGTNPTVTYVGADRPAIQVTRQDVGDFVKALRKRSGLLFDIPTVAEWQAACDISIPSQNDLSDTDKSKLFWIGKKETEGPCKVRSHIERHKNQAGIYHMLGNVWEWTKEESDKQSREYYFLGGSWQHGVDYCSSEANIPAPMLLKSEDIGFRLVWRFDLSSLDKNTRQQVKTMIETWACVPTCTIGERIVKLIKGVLLILILPLWFCEKTWGLLVKGLRIIEECVRLLFITHIDPVLSQLWGHITDLLSVRPSEKHLERVLGIGDEYRKQQIAKLLKNMVAVEDGYCVIGTENKRNEDEPQTHQEQLPLNWRDVDAEINESPHHFVHVSSFCMLSTPVTQQLWNLVMGETSFTNPSASNIGDNYPQTNVSWNEVRTFLKRLNNLMGATFRLPTSAEWEYAAKDGHKSLINTKLALVFDNDKLTGQQKQIEAYRVLAHYERYSMYSGSNNPEDIGKYEYAELYEVGQYKGNELKLMDMSGCVYEWCEDIDCDEYYSTIVNSEEYKQNGFYEATACPKTKGHTDRVYRGGGWKDKAVNCRTTFRFGAAERDVEDNLGFRIVIDKQQYEEFCNEWYEQDNNS